MSSASTSTATSRVDPPSGLKAARHFVDTRVASASSCGSEGCPSCELSRLEALARDEEIAPLRRHGIAGALSELHARRGGAEPHELRESAVEDLAEQRGDLPDVHAERVVRDGVLPHEAHVARELVG
eukprot:scaffold22479_cov63-Phaeocystis_antarctica.AAC.4